MRRVIVESPYAGKTPEEVEANIAYARAAVRDCVLRGEAPIASHLLFTQPGILRDQDQGERALGMKAGMAWTEVADAVVVYIDRGISPGMRAGISRAQRLGLLVEERRVAPAKMIPPAPHEVPTPASLRDLLLAIGHDVPQKALVNAAKDAADVAAAAAWARSEHEHAQGTATHPRVPCPPWLDELLEPLPDTARPPRT